MVQRGAHGIAEAGEVTHQFGGQVERAGEVDVSRIARLDGERRLAGLQSIIVVVIGAH